MSAPDRPTREQVDEALVHADEMADWSAKMDRAVLAAEVRALRAELASAHAREARADVESGRVDDAVRDPSGRSYDDAYLDELADEAERLGPPQVPPVLAEKGRLQVGYGFEMGMRTAAVDELETLRRHLWGLLDANQLSDDDTVDRLGATLAARAEMERRAHLVAWWPHPGPVAARFILGQSSEPRSTQSAVQVVVDAAREVEAARSDAALNATAHRVRVALHALDTAPLPAVPDGEDPTDSVQAPDEIRLCGAADGSVTGRTCTKPAGHVPHNARGVTWVVENAATCPGCGEDVWTPQYETGPDGEDVPVRLDAAADAIQVLGWGDYAEDLRNAAVEHRHAPPDVRAAVAAALARPTGGAS